MEDFIRKEFEAINLHPLGRGLGGCISDGMGYDLDNGRKRIFVKRNKDEQAKVMFTGEYQSLARIAETNTVRVPRPEKVLTLPGTNDWVFVMEYIEMSSLSKYMRQLGVDLARLHLDNMALESKQTSRSVHVKADNRVYQPRFGFECDTCCGSIPMPNEWESDWINFYAKQRLKYQIDLAMKKHYNKEVLEYWSLLERKLPSYFKGVDCIKPSLLHGDLWAGNASETPDGPVVFDAASFYGHSEFDLAITRMFGGFDKDFYEGYHSLIPKTPGFDSRQDLYLLFHYLNHWNHFGSGYMHQSLQLMKKLA